MKKTSFALATMLLAGSFSLAIAADRWLHVRVDETQGKAERVRINLPLELAEKVLPAIQHDKLQGGKVKVSEAKINNVDLRIILETVRTAQDNEFITVESDHENVRVAKSGGNLIVQVREEKGEGEKVNITVPLPVIDALFSAGKDELDLLAAVRALSAVGDTVLVSVDDVTSRVRIWVDAKNTQD